MATLLCNGLVHYYEQIEGGARTGRKENFSVLKDGVAWWTGRCQQICACVDSNLL